MRYHFIGLFHKFLYQNSTTSFCSCKIILFTVPKTFFLSIFPKSKPNLNFFFKDNTSSFKYIILKRIKQLHGSKLNSATNHLLPLWVGFPPCPPFCRSFERIPPQYSWHTLAWFQRTQNHQQPEINFKKIHVKQESAQPYKVISDQCTVCITKERCNQCIKKYKYYKGFFYKQDDFHI